MLECVPPVIQQEWGVETWLYLPSMPLWISLSLTCVRWVNLCRADANQVDFLSLRVQGQRVTLSAVSRVSGLSSLSEIGLWEKAREGGFLIEFASSESPLTLFSYSLSNAFLVGH